MDNSALVHALLEGPDDGNRYEVINGELIASPAPNPRHQRMGDRLCRLLTDNAPSGTETVTATAVRCGQDGLVLVPDVVVGCFDPLSGSVIEVAEVLAVVEVVSPGSRRRDRSAKPEIYAAAGIPTFWRVELDPFPGQLPTEEPPVVLVYALVGSEYQLAARLAAGSLSRADLPYPVEFDPAALLRSR